MVKIYHNNRCSKSRGACYTLEENGIKTEIIEYLKTPPTQAEIKDILEKLDMKAFDIVRKNEELYKSNFAGTKFSESEWIKILSENPILIERPIIVHGNKAVIGRPPERVLELFK